MARVVACGTGTTTEASSPLVTVSLSASSSLITAGLAEEVL